MHNIQYNLMAQYGEPEIHAASIVQYIWEGVQKSNDFGDDYIRIMHGMPYLRKFDARYYSGTSEAKVVGLAWRTRVVDALEDEVHTLRDRGISYQSEDIYEVSQ